MAVHGVRPAGTGPDTTESDFDVAVLGGTGFIGARVVNRFLAAGLRVGVTARNTANLPPVFDDESVTLIRGDVSLAGDVDRAIGRASVVVNLAPGGGRSWPEVERSMVGGARLVAECCRRKGVSTLIHVSSIVALYLGDETAVITGATPADPWPEKRGTYARGKAVSERLLLDMHRSDGLPVCILRPGIVLGAGGKPLHGGVGLYSGGRQCLGWTTGDVPLPFVLAGDVADAVVRAARKEGLAGRCYNLVGDVPMTAREYIDALARAMDRPLRFHGRSLFTWRAVEVGKWMVKRLIGRTDPFPSYRDLKSRRLTARFDCGDAKRDLGWRPVADGETFRRLGIDVYGKAPPDMPSKT